MPQQIEFEGQVHEFPDDFTDADIQQALGGSTPASVPSPTSSVSAPPSGIGQTLRDFESDLRYGGGMTMAGRALRYLGAQGISQGAQAGAGEMMGSIPLGLTQMAQGVAEKSPLRFAKGALIASQIPASFVAPEASNALPNITRAKDVLETVSKVAPESSVPMTERLSQTIAESLAQKNAGTFTPQVVTKLLRRISDETQGPLTFQEARRFLSNMNRKLSPAASANMDSNSYRILANLKHAFGEAVQMNRNAAGVGQEYAQGINEFRQASQLNRASDRVVKVLAGAAGTTAAGALAHQGWKMIRK